MSKRTIRWTYMHFPVSWHVSSALPYSLHHPNCFRILSTVTLMYSADVSETFYWWSFLLFQTYFLIGARNNPTRHLTSSRSSTSTSRSSVSPCTLLKNSGPPFTTMLEGISTNFPFSRSGGDPSRIEVKFQQFVSKGFLISY